MSCIETVKFMKMQFITVTLPVKKEVSCGSNMLYIREEKKSLAKIILLNPKYPEYI